MTNLHLVLLGFTLIAIAALGMTYCPEQQKLWSFICGNGNALNMMGILKK